MFTIYGFGTFNPIKVLLTAEELGLQYNYVKVDLAKGENKTPEFLEKNPLGKVPVLEHNGHRFLESASICRYLANVSDQRLYSTDPVKAAQIDQMVDFMGLHIGRWLGAHFWQEVVRKVFMRLESDPAAIEEAKNFLAQQLPVLDGMIGDSPFLVGNDITIADTIAHACFQVQEVTSVDTTPYPNLHRWYQSFSQRPSVAKVQQLVSA